MRQARAVMVAVMRQKNLRLVRQSAKSRGMQDTVTVALEGAARPAFRFVM
jgi:hypothetical protein